MPHKKKPICLECGDKRAKWPVKLPTFCTQRCAAYYGFGCADNQIQFPGKRAWIAVADGKFEIQECINPGKGPDIVTDDPEEAREFLLRARVGSVMCSSSVDFCEEYGMDRKKVRDLLGEDY